MRSRIVWAMSIDFTVWQKFTQDSTSFCGHLRVLDVEAAQTFQKFC